MCFSFFAGVCVCVCVWGGGGGGKEILQTGDLPLLTIKCYICL